MTLHMTLCCLCCSTCLQTVSQTLARGWADLLHLAIVTAVALLMLSCLLFLALGPDRGNISTLGGQMSWHGNLSNCPDHQCA